MSAFTKYLPSEAKRPQTTTVKVPGSAFSLVVPSKTEYHHSSGSDIEQLSKSMMHMQVTQNNNIFQPVKQTSLP